MLPVKSQRKSLYGYYVGPHLLQAVLCLSASLCSGIFLFLIWNRNKNTDYINYCSVYSLYFSYVFLLVIVPGSAF